ncbi:MAG: ABC transporter substrate-binding protein [Caldilineaceae bacterium]|nr:ABC transporter substrate-binding protein [Caldilineaceae bacterium]
MRSALTWVTLLLLSIWILTSCVNPIETLTKPDEEFRIGLIAPLTGPSQLSGKGLRRGAELAVAEVNAEGGLLVGDVRIPIVLRIEDNQSKPELSVEAAQRLVDQGIVAVVGPATSANAIPTAELLEKERTLMIAPVSSNPETTRNKRYIFRIIATDDVQAEVLAEFALKELKTTRAAVLYTQDDVYSAFLADVFASAYKELGGVIVASEPFAAEASDFMPQLARIKAQEPDLLLLPNQAHSIPATVHQARNVGLDIPILGADAWTSIPAEELDSDFDNTYFTSAWSPTIQSARAQAFVAAFQQTYHAQPTAVEALTYDAFHLLFAAAQQQESFTTRALLKGISVMESFEGVSGKATYLGQGNPIRDMTVLAIRNGEHHFVKVVEP